MRRPWAGGFCSRLLVLITAALIAVPTAVAATPARPNFVVVLCDDLGWGDLASYGHPHIRTPHLDTLAREGMRFTSAYSAAPVCSPARVGLLTGRSPNRAGVFDWIPPAAPDARTAQSRHLTHLRREEVTLPKVLRTAGYATALAGKWHCNAVFNHPSQAQPDDAGFDHWFATQNNAAPSHENPINFVRNGQPVGPLNGFSCDLVVSESIGWLERHVAEDPARPFFLYVSFHEPHEPVASPADLVASYQEAARSVDEAEYFANVTNLDRAVGKLLQALDRLELAENTLIFFTSDNGPETLNRHRAANRSFGTPGPLRGMKLWTTEAGVRVPGILRWPARVKAGQLSDETISSLDLLPTFAALAGARVPMGLRPDGIDIQSIFSGGSVERTNPLFWVYYNAINEQRVALRDGAWKLLARIEGGDFPRLQNLTASLAPAARRAELTDFSLYHLDNDIAESVDLSAEEPARLKELVQKMESIYRELTATMHVWPDVEPRP